MRAYNIRSTAGIAKIATAGCCNYLVISGMAQDGAGAGRSTTLFGGRAQKFWGWRFICFVSGSYWWASWSVAQPYCSVLNPSAQQRLELLAEKATNYISYTPCLRRDIKNKNKTVKSNTHLTIQFSNAKGFNILWHLRCVGGLMRQCPHLWDRTVVQTEK